MAKKKPSRSWSKLRKQQLIREYKKKAAAADKALYRLEKLAQDVNFKGVKTWAYARAMKDIEKWRGEGAKRFGQTPPRTIQGIRAKMRDIETFMSSPTSGKRKILEIYKKRAATYKERYGIEADWQTMAVFFVREYHTSLFKEYGSKTAMKILGKISQNENKIKRALKEDNLKELHLDDDKVINDRVKEMLSEYENELRAIGFDI